MKVWINKAFDKWIYRPLVWEHLGIWIPPHPFITKFPANSSHKLFFSIFSNDADTCTADFGMILNKSFFFFCEQTFTIYFYLKIWLAILHFILLYLPVMANPTFSYRQVSNTKLIDNQPFWLLLLINFSPFEQVVIFFQSLF